MAIDIQTNFTTLDWCIAIGYLLIIIATTIYVKRFVSSITDFLVAGRAVKPFLGTATMIGSELGLITVMYSSQKGFTGGFAAFHIALVAAIVTLIVGLTGFIVVPLRRLNIMTIPEFYNKRFGRGVQVFGGIVLAISGILNMGMFLKAGSLFVMGVTGLTSDFYLKLIMTLLLAMVLFCISLGGMVSVVILDYIRFIVISIALLLTSWLAIKNLGWTNIVETIQELKGEAGFNPFTEEGFGADYVIWMVFAGLVSCAIWQTAVMRACAAESTKAVKKLYTWSAIGFLIRLLIPYFFGICAFVYISQTPDLKSVFLPESGNVDPQLTLMAMPIFIGKILPVGIIGLVTAGMLAAFGSTHQSYLLCWSSVLTQDVVAPFFKKGLSSNTRIWLTRGFIILIGIYLLFWGLWYPLGQDLWDYLVIAGAIYTCGAASLMVFGLYWKRASRVGAYLSLACGFLAFTGLKPVQDLLGISVSSEKVGLTVLGLSIVLMVFGSLVFPDKKMPTTENKEQ